MNSVEHCKRDIIFIFIGPAQKVFIIFDVFVQLHSTVTTVIIRLIHSLKNHEYTDCHRPEANTLLYCQQSFKGKMRQMPFLWWLHGVQGHAKWHDRRSVLTWRDLSWKFSKYRTSTATDRHTHTHRHRVLHCFKVMLFTQTHTVHYRENEKTQTRQASYVQGSWMKTCIVYTPVVRIESTSKLTHTHTLMYTIRERVALEPKSSETNLDSTKHWNSHKRHVTVLYTVPLNCRLHCTVCVPCLWESELWTTRFVCAEPSKVNCQLHNVMIYESE